MLKSSKDETSRASSNRPEIDHIGIIRKMLAKRHRPGITWEEVFDELVGAVVDLIPEVFPSLMRWSAVSEQWSNSGGPPTVATGSSIKTAHLTALLDFVRCQCRPALFQSGRIVSWERERPVSILRNVQAIAVPLFGWERTAAKKVGHLSGCLVVRAGENAGLSAKYLGWILDLVDLAETIWNANAESEKSCSTCSATPASPPAVNENRRLWTLGPIFTADFTFYESVLLPLQRAAAALRVTVLMTGPTGSGKSSLAAAFHQVGARQDGPFVVFDCAQVTSGETMGTELFGFAPESGYANAPRGGRDGKARLAHGGVLFIDEIGCLTLELQHRLLRLIERGTFSPLGSSRDVSADLTIIAATNQDLGELVKVGRFREDLFWRLSALRVRVPDLGRHRADISELANQLLIKACEAIGRQSTLTLSGSALEVLQTFDWSRNGNIRGLEHAMFRTALMASQDTTILEPHSLMLNSPGYSGASGIESASREMLTQVPSDELERIRQAVLKYGYGTRAAQALGISHRMLTWRLQRSGLSVRAILSDSGGGTRARR